MQDTPSTLFHIGLEHTNARNETVVETNYNFYMVILQPPQLVESGESGGV